LFHDIFELFLPSLIAVPHEVAVANTCNTILTLGAVMQGFGVSKQDSKRMCFILTISPFLPLVGAPDPQMNPGVLPDNIKGS